MKLLLDENLAAGIVPKLQDIYPGSAHVRDHDLIQSDDSIIWEFALEQGFVLVSKDLDFYQRSLVFGHPPKVVLLRVGNCSTARITGLLRTGFRVLSDFGSDPNASVLVLS